MHVSRPFNETTNFRPSTLFKHISPMTATIIAAFATSVSVFEIANNGNSNASSYSYEIAYDGKPNASPYLDKTSDLYAFNDPSSNCTTRERSGNPCP